jgi:pyrroloquinoline quinone (PQQ) biosynthesis protein C
MAATTERTTGLVPGDRFLEELEEIREEVTEGKPLRPRTVPRTFEEAVASRRHNAGVTGIGLPKTNYERYLRVPDPEMRRAQLRKTIDEAGQDIFGGPTPAHSELDRVVNRAFGVTDEEMAAAGKRESSAQSLICTGWYHSMLRDAPWPFGIGTALVGEGEKLNPKRRAWTLQHMDELREAYESWGMPNVGQATIRDDVHAEADVEHSNLDCDVIRDYIVSPEWQEGFRKAFTLRIQQIQSWKL